MIFIYIPTVPQSNPNVLTKAILNGKELQNFRIIIALFKLIVKQINNLIYLFNK